MKIIKADNYQTWYLENNNNAILIDPWLTNTLQPEGSFFIQRKKNNSSCLSKVEIGKVNGIIITAPFEDHLHLETINMLADIPIYTSKIVKNHGIRLKPRLFRSHNPMATRKEAEKMEAEKARRLKKRGYWVWYN